MSKKITKKLQKLPTIHEDNALHENASSLIVGIGASAGGLEAFAQFITELPNDTGMAFVLIQHLSPDHVSNLADILSRKTAMPVKEAQHLDTVQPNHIYVIPPGMDMTIAQKQLHLMPRSLAQRLHRPIDQFFTSLAEDQKSRAIGVVLSGAATDGTSGLEAIKLAGGITFAQDDTAETRSMPHSAISSGYVDFVLAPAQIADELVRISKHPYAASELQSSGSSMDLAPFVQLLHHATGMDFTHYKPNTLYRRISRRMVLNKIEGIKEYLQFLQENQVEVEALYQDILINVTNFFRNPEAFETLKTKIFPKLLKDRTSNDPLRVWTLGCSTGEEAYSLAIAFTEYVKETGQHLQLQLFATDLNNSCIQKARTGIYPKTIREDVSQERLERFFVEVDGGYRVTKSIRDICIFSKHNVVTDPSFSRMDLISCRNLLIYLEQALQQHVMSVLHYALKPDGVLWLGSSETIGSYRNFFEVEDAKNKFYSKKPGATPAAQSRLAQSKIHRSDNSFTPTRPSEGNMDLQKQADRTLLNKYAPPSVLITPTMEILQFRGDTSPYLTPAPGKASLNMMKMLREGLLIAVRAAIGRASKDMMPVREKGLRVKSGREYHEVAIEVIPIKKNTTNDGGFLVIFEEFIQPPLPEQQNNSTSPFFEANAAAEQVERLTQELSDTREYLQSVIDQQEIANEELQTAHEEVQSTNEELQSINEELETSKEEIQASNEELATINDELNNRNQEMSRVNNDIVNLMSNTQLAIVMLDMDLRIRRLTPWAEKMFNLIPTDIGRHFCDIKLNFSSLDIETLLREVLNESTLREVEIQNKEGRWYSLRIRPYKTTDNIIDGIVIMLVDIDTLKRASEYTESIVETVREPLLVLDANMRLKTASRAFWEIFKLSPENALNQVIFNIGNHQWDIPQLRKLLQEILPHDNFFNDFEVEHEFKHLGKRTLIFTARKLIQHDNNSPAILLAIEDITDRKQLETALRHRTEDLVAADTRKNEFLATLAHELRTPLAPLSNALEIMQMPNATKEMVTESRALMERQLHQMVRLVDDLLDVSRITFGKIELRMKPLILAEVLKTAVETVTPLIKEYNHTLSIDIGEKEIYVQADMIRLAQIFANLLNNAAKYTKPGGHIELTARRMGDEAIITIADDGIGIAPDKLSEIFNMFSQVGALHANIGGGLGIGLNLVKSLLALHQGTVEAYSAGLGKGSEFTVKLPIISEPGRQQNQRHPTRAPLEKSAFCYRILVVDDNVASAQTMGWILELMGHEVKLAHSGSEAIDIAHSFIPHIMLLDIGLPSMSGYDVCKRMRAEPLFKDTVFIAQTGWGQEEDRQLSKEAGFDYHLVKPLNISTLKEIFQVIDNKDKV